MKKFIDVILEDAPYVDFMGLIDMLKSNTLTENSDGIITCSDMPCSKCPIEYTCDRNDFKAFRLDNILEELIDIKSSNPEYFV